MVSSISSSTLAVPSSAAKDASTADVKSMATADSALNALLSNGDFLQSLANKSSQWVAPSKGLVMAVLWGLVNPSERSFITQDDVRLAIYNEEGSTVQADALWAQFSPDKKTSVSAADFATNLYLSKALGANGTQLTEAIDEARRKSDITAASAGNVLDGFVGGGGSVLDLFT
jgi:hypothetical protein